MKQTFLGVAKGKTKKGFLTALAILIAVLFPAVSLADAVVQSYNAQGTLKPGRIVELSSKNTVAAAPAQDSTKIFGVVVDSAAAPVVVTTDTGKVYVATGGTYPVLVSNENGPIASGDYVSLSSTDGIGAKATDSESNILGQATTGFDGQKNVITKDGSLAIGQVNVQVSIGTNPLHSKQGSVPDALQKIASALSGGRTVSSVRIYSALVVFLLAFMAAISLVWSGVKNGMISIGRNPLSRKSILSSLTEVIVFSIIIFGIGMLAVYLILRL